MLVCTNQSVEAVAFCLVRPSDKEGCDQNVGTTLAAALGSTLILVMSLTLGIAYH